MNKENISLTHLTQVLKERSKDDLINDLAELFARFDVVKDYYRIQLGPAEDTQVIEKYKKIIRHEFFPTRGLGGLRLAVARKAITDYKKVCENPANVAELMLFYVEQGVQFTNTYGDVYESFYNSMESVFAAALQHIVKHNLQDQFEEPCRQIVKQTAGCGWGFHDGLVEIYDEAFGYK